MFEQLTKFKKHTTGRSSSYDVEGRNADSWSIPAGESRVIADIKGPGQITHIWMTQMGNYREVLIKITWDNADRPSVLCPLGDFFCLGHGMVNSFQSALFTSSTHFNKDKPGDAKVTPPIGGGAAFNCYAPMQFRSRAIIEIVNEGSVEHSQYFYVDFETFKEPLPKELAYFHAEFRRTNPFSGWAPNLHANTPPVDIINKERTAWDNNYVILETKGRGHYIGCNISITNFQETWWGEGDDMIWVDGYKWPPDLHGTGAEDYLNQAWEMQPNAFLHNGSSIFEHFTGGYQTSYVFHLENPVRFNREIKVTIEHGHGNHLGNEMSSVAYWYADAPAAAIDVPPVMQRLPVLKEKVSPAPSLTVHFPFPDGRNGAWVHDPARQCPGKPVKLTDEMKEARTPRPVMQLKLKRLSKVPALSGLAVALAKESEIVFGGDLNIAKLRLALAGRFLAVHAKVFDSDIKRAFPEFWKGSVLEIFASPSEFAPIGQVVLLPASKGKKTAAQAYILGDPSPSTGVKMTFRSLKEGYEMNALIPLQLLQLSSSMKEFRFDAIIGVGADSHGASRRTGMSGANVPHFTAAGYARVRVV